MKKKTIFLTLLVLGLIVTGFWQFLPVFAAGSQNGFITIDNLDGLSSQAVIDVKINSSNGGSKTIKLKINPPLINGVCGATNNVCTAGALNDTVDNATQYLWQCLGSGGGTTASCSINKSLPVNGVCGAANNVCTAGNLSDIADNATQYLWQCIGINGGTTASCSLNKVLPVNGVCGAANNVCTAGALNDTVDNATQYLWQCLGSGGGTTASCSINKSLPVNGVCGAANNVCTAGNLSDIADNATQYLWQCIGINGGTTASCSLNKLLPPPTPTGLSVTPSVCGNNWLNISWNVSAGATNYQVYRDSGTTPISLSSYSCNAVSCSGSDTGLVLGSNHSYTVRATNLNGPSALSPSVANTVAPACAAAPSASCDTVSWYATSGWGYRKVITLNSSMVPSNQTNFPVMIKLTSDTDLSIRAQADGDDIFFTSSDGVTKLAHEIESYSSGNLVAWVKVPTLSSAANTKIYMYYGNSGASNMQLVAPVKTSVWNNNFVSVHHLNEGSGTTLYDSTINSLNVRKLSELEPSTVTLVNGTSQSFDGANDYIYDATTNSAFNIQNGTISLWYKVAGPVAAPRYLVSKDGAGNNNGDGDIVIIESNNATNPNKMGLYSYSSSMGTQFIYSDAAAPFGVWTHVAANFGTGGMKLFINGVQQSQTSANTVGWQNAAVPLLFGILRPATYPYNGLIDEVHISNVSRSTDWITTEYNNQSNPSVFHGVSSQCFPPLSAAVTLTVDNLSSDGSCGPNCVTIPQNTSATINWEYFGASSCNTVNFSIPAPLVFPANSGDVSTGALLNGKIYTLICQPGNATDQIAVNVATNKNLVVVKTGQGIVTSVSDPEQTNINCGSSCSAQYSEGTEVVLTETPNPGRIFTGWGGVACSGSGETQKTPTCTFILNSDLTIYANFAIDPDYKEF